MSYTRPDGVVFKVGDRVRGWGHCGYQQQIGLVSIGVITRLYVSERHPHNQHTADMNLIVDMEGTDQRAGDGSAIWLCSAAHYCTDLDTSRPLRCRDPQYKATNVSRHGDRIAALVQLPSGRELNLSYGLDGHFYNFVDLPLDLVEAR